MPSEQVVTHPFWGQTGCVASAISHKGRWTLALVILKDGQASKSGIVWGATQFPFGEPGTCFPPELHQPLKPKAEPRWHQVIGVHAILEGAFTTQLRECSRPTVLCDDVGLGKTLQIIGIFSMLSHLYEQQLLGKEWRLPLPPFTIGKLKISDLFWGL
jgi:hypothetical protein